MTGTGLVSKGLTQQIKQESLRCSTRLPLTATSLSSHRQDRGQFAKSGQNRLSAVASSAGIMAGLLTFVRESPMLLIRLLNACHRLPSFGYEGTRLNEAMPSQIEPAFSGSAERHHGNAGAVSGAASRPHPVLDLDA
jgi:hypothetical protein